MCVSIAHADFYGTKICLNDTVIPELGGRVHVLMYQNRTVTFEGPNAMLLHIPAAEIGQANFIDTRSFPHVLDDMIKAVTPRGRGGYPSSFGSKGLNPNVEV